MKLEGRKVMVNKSTKDLFEMLKKPEDYKHLMPESLVSFETTENGIEAINSSGSIIHRVFLIDTLRLI